MNLMHIAGMGGAALVKELFPGITRDDPRPDGSGRIPGSAGDDVMISETAKLKFEEDEGGDIKARDFLNNFRLALIKFSDFLRHKMGMIGQATDQQGYLALSELANRSGISMPDLLDEEGQAQLLESFRKEWGLSEASSVPEILDKMKEVFGGTDSLQRNGPSDEGTVAPPVGAEDNRAHLPEHFREAMAVFMEKLFDGEPGQEQYRRVVTALSENLGLPMMEKGFNYQGIVEALEIRDDASAREIYAQLERALFA